MVKVSIIVPVYNVEKYLQECVESILCQSMKDIEVILIDDGSTDNSPAICDALVSIDNRIRVFHQPNSGVSVARNKGLDEARGEWISFVDSDDWIGEDYCSKILDPRVTKEIGVLYWGVNLARKGGTITERVSNLEGIVSGSDFFENVSFGVCFQMIRRNLIEKRKIRYTEGITCHEDKEFMFKCFWDTEILCFPINSYYYRFNESSVSNSKQTYKKAHDILLVAERICLYLKGSTRKYPYPSSLNKHLLPLRPYIFNVNKLDIDDKTIRNDVKHLYNSLVDVKFSIGERLFYFLFLSFPNFVICLISVGYNIFKIIKTKHLSW